jgi:hypothetical protein
MGNEMIISEKARRLSDTYLRIDDEGRNILDMVIQELYKTHGDPEEVERIKQLAFVKPLKSMHE